MAQPDKFTTRYFTAACAASASPLCSPTREDEVTDSMNKGMMYLRRLTVEGVTFSSIGSCPRMCTCKSRSFS
eukprot:Skav232921  [mRNA]  locus=scaffold1477:794302:796273:+ [translate_table: standard]